jgi:hypothetical protein
MTDNDNTPSTPAVPPEQLANVTAGPVPADIPLGGADPASDAVQRRLDDLRRQKADREAAANDPRLAEIAALERELSAPAAPVGNAWDDIPKIADTPESNLSPEVAEILKALKEAQAKNAELERLIASQGAPSRDAAESPLMAFHLDDGRVVQLRSAYATHYHDGDTDTLHRVLSAHLVGVAA